MKDAIKRSKGKFHGRVTQIEEVQWEFRNHGFDGVRQYPRAECRHCLAVLTSHPPLLRAHLQKCRRYEMREKELLRNEEPLQSAYELMKSARDLERLRAYRNDIIAERHYFEDIDSTDEFLYSRVRCRKCSVEVADYLPVLRAHLKICIPECLQDEDGIPVSTDTRLEVQSSLLSPGYKLIFDRLTQHMDLPRKPEVTTLSVVKDRKGVALPEEEEQLRTNSPRAPACNYGDKEECRREEESLLSEDKFKSSNQIPASLLHLERSARKLKGRTTRYSEFLA